MRRRDYGNFIVYIFIALAFCGLIFSINNTYSPIKISAAKNNSSFVPGRYLVLIDKDKVAKQPRSIFKIAEAGDIVGREGKDWISIKVESEKELEKIKKLETVKAVLPEPKRFTMAPDDSFYNSQNNIISGRYDQWNLRQIGLKPTSDITSAWNTTTGSESTIVSIIDTGVTLANPDIGGGSGSNWTENNIWINQQEIPNAIKTSMDTNVSGDVDSVEMITYFRNNNLDVNIDGAINFLDMVATGSPLRNGVDNNSPTNGYIDDIFGYNFADNNPNLNDTDGHGTHVFGIIGATTNNNATANPGVAGVCWTCKIMPLRVINSSGFGYDSDIADAIDYSVANGAKVINMSLGGPGYSQVLEDAIANAWNNGVLVVAASGNFGTSASDSYPGGSQRAISVGSSNYLDQIPGYSNTGQRLDMVAPGDYILSTYLNSPSSCVGAGYYACSSGTSMASPHVAGVAALLFDLHKSDPSPWTSKQVRSALLKNTTDLLTAGFDTSSGLGRLEAGNALSASTLSEDLTSPTSSLTALGNPLVRGNVNITGTASDTNLYIYTLSFIRVSDAYTVKQVSGRTSITNNTLTTLNTLQLSDDVYNVKMIVEDYWGNTTTSNTIQITVDNTAPANFSLNTPSNLSYTINPRPVFSWNASSDAHGITYDVIANSSNLVTDTSATSFTPSTDLAEGVYSWNVNAKDTAGNIRSSATYSFTADRTPPNAFTVGVSVNGTAPTYTFNTSDGVSGIAGYQYSLNGGSFQAISSPFSPGNQAQGNYSITVRAIDNAGNYIDSTANYSISDICGPRKTKADFNCDGIVNISDLSILASNWTLNVSTADANSDGVVNISDLSILASNWLQNV